MAETAIKVEPIEDSTGRGRTVRLEAVKSRISRSHRTERSLGMLELLCLLLRDPFVGAGVEQIERQRAPVEHLVVKLAEIEFRAILFLRMFAEFTVLE